MIHAIRTVFTPKEFTGWHMFGVLALFFGTIITVNMWLAYNAGATWTGLVVKNTYIESQLFNARVETLDAQTAKGWTTKVDYDAGVLRVQLLDAMKVPLADKKVIGLIGRPVHEGQDQTVSLFAKDGYFVAPVALTSGLWRVTVQASDAGKEEWVQTLRFTIGANGKSL